MVLVTAICVMVAILKIVSPMVLLAGLLIILPIAGLGCFVWRAGKIDFRLKRAGIVLFLVGCVVLFAVGAFPKAYYLEGFVYFFMAYIGVSMTWLSLSASSISKSSTDDKSPAPKTSVALVLIPFLMALCLYYQVPMRIVAYFPLATLENRIAELQTAPKGTIQCGPYLLRTPPVKRGNRLCFLFASDSDSYFVYSPTPVIRKRGKVGVGRNPGSEGHLFGNWYWAKDD